MTRVRTSLESAGIPAVMAAVIGLAGGYVTFRVENSGGTLLFGLAHGVVPWGMLTLAVATLFRRRWQYAVLAGLVVQLGLVVGYYVSEADLTDRPFATQSLVTYSAVACVAGPVLALAALHLRDRRGLLRTSSFAVVSLPWLLDGIRGLMVAHAIHDHTLAATVIYTCYLAVGLALPAFIGGSTRSWLLSVGSALGVCGLAIALSHVA
jgi:hypothetical protein